MAYGGSLSGEHGDGQSRAELRPKMFGHTLVGAFREFKRIWDPDGLMNPGKLVDAYAATDHLRRPGYRPEPGRSFFQLADECGISGAARWCVGVGNCRKGDEGTMCPELHGDARGAAFDARSGAPDGVSMAIGERVLLPAVRQAPQAVTIIVNGFSCPEQIRHATNRAACHFAELVSQQSEVSNEGGAPART